MTHKSLTAKPYISSTTTLDQSLKRDIASRYPRTSTATFEEPLVMKWKNKKGKIRKPKPSEQLGSMADNGDADDVYDRS